MGTVKEQVIEMLRQVAENPQIAQHARLVGSWIWIATPERNNSVSSWLKSRKFYWNAKRNVWQWHAIGQQTGPARRYDPRDKYQVRQIAAVLQDSAL